MREILYAGDGIWNDPARPVYDPRELAWVDNEDVKRLRDHLGPADEGVRDD